MTSVVLYFTAGGERCGFEGSGHAGYAETGRDIVCAALSFLSVTCANALESVAGVVPRVTEGDGRLRVIVPPASINHDALVILGLFQQGVSDLQKSYPAYIKVINAEVHEEVEELP